MGCIADRAARFGAGNVVAGLAGGAGVAGVFGADAAGRCRRRAPLRPVARSRPAFGARCVDRGDGVDAWLDRRDPERGGFPADRGGDVRSVDVRGAIGVNRTRPSLFYPVSDGWNEAGRR